MIRTVAEANIDKRVSQLGIFELWTQIKMYINSKPIRQDCKTVYFVNTKSGGNDDLWFDEVDNIINIVNYRLTCLHLFRNSWK